MKRVAQLWSWLPTFRAAGETELLSRAGEELGVSTSAVSRAVRLLEDNVGVTLFDRRGRSLSLNEAGQVFLSATRHAMRLMDEAIADVQGNRERGIVRIVCDEPLASLFLLPVLAKLKRSQPGLLPHISRSAGLDLASLLRKGDIDIAVSSRELGVPGLEVHLLGLVASSYYVGPSHPLYRARSVSKDALERCARAVLGGEERGDPSLSEQVALVVDDLSLLIAAAHSGEYTALLPDALAARHPALRRLCPDARAPLNAFVTHRERLSVLTRADVIIDALLGA